MLTATTLGTVATVVAALGVLSRLLLRARPLYHLIPAPYRCVPDAVAAGVGVLLLGLPNAGTVLEVVEVAGLAAIAAALTVAPGAAAPTYPEIDQ